MSYCEVFNMKKILYLVLAVILFSIGGKVMAQDILTVKQHDIVLIASYTARGEITELEKSLNKALDDKLTINEIKEVLVQMYAYCGFPRSLNSLGVFQKVVNSRQGDILGEEGVVLPASVNKNEYGTRVQTELVGQPVKGDVFEFAPAIDQYLKEHLFADIFARGILTNQEREIATIAAFSSLQGVESQLNSHIKCGKNTGLSDKQINEILDLTKGARSGAFNIGVKNDAYAKYFIGQSYLQPLTTEGVNSANVTFEPKCRNNWHIHHKGGQILLVTSGRGYYQEWGKPAQELKTGDVVNIPAGVKHWHGATDDSWFSHVAIAVPAEGATTEWLEKVSDEEYSKL